MGILWDHGFSEADKQAIAMAIWNAEQSTSGEIRVYFERTTEGEPVLDRASKAFAGLKMHETDLRNGVLIYIAFDDHQFALLGDEGIHNRVHQHFWDQMSQMLCSYFRKGEFVPGLEVVIKTIGIQLANHYPISDKDKNELPNEPYFKNEPK